MANDSGIAASGPRTGQLTPDPNAALVEAHERHAGTGLARSTTTQHKEYMMQKFDTPAPISAVLNIPAGRVEFIAADQADTAVEVLPANASKSRDVKAAEQTTIEYADGVLRIETLEKNQYL